MLNNFFIDLSRRGFLLANRGWYGRLMTSEDFVERVIGRYRQLREGILSDEYLLNYIQEVSRLSWSCDRAKRRRCVGLQL